MNTIKFNIKKQYGLTSGPLTPQNCNEKNEKQKTTLLHTSTSKNTIPAMMRRRMSEVSQLAVQVAMELSQNESIDFIVFSSQHGELQRTLVLLEDILKGEPASPTAFSLSVHNTASALFTIACQHLVPASALSAGIDSFHYALTEAGIYLNEKPKHTVLVVDFDAPLPAPYCPFQQVNAPPYAVGFLLEAGEQYTLTREGHTALAFPSSALQKTPQAIECYENIHQKKEDFTFHSPKQTWHWKTHSF